MNKKRIESFFETAMWQTRFLVLLAVIFGLLGSVVLFIVASIDISMYAFNIILEAVYPKNFHENIVSGIIGAVDLYLIAIVLLIFSFGIYELFISRIDHNKVSSEDTKILSISSLD